MTRRRWQHGFTLLEVLVVVSVIGILAGVVAVNLNSARVLARDARRKQDVQQIQSALELYYNDHRAYPAGAASLGTELKQYLSTIPKDPSTLEEYTYVSGGGATVNCTQWYAVTYRLEDKRDAIFGQTRQVKGCDKSRQSDQQTGDVVVGASLP